MNFDELLKKFGEFGPYQKRIYALLCIISFAPGFHMVASVFLLATPNHR